MPIQRWKADALRTLADKAVSDQRRLDRTLIHILNYTTLDRATVRALIDDAIDGRPPYLAKEHLWRELLATAKPDTEE